MSTLASRQEAAISDSIHYLLSETFRDLDRQFGDGDGEISKAEFRRYPGVSPGEADELFSQMDLNGDESI